jgi:DNA topoisomerase III
MTTEAIREGFASGCCRARSSRASGSGQCARLLGLADRHERDPRAHQAAQEPARRTAWSAGRVQTPTLALLVERELEVLAHVPRPYWRIDGELRPPGHRVQGTWFDPAFRDGADEEARDDRLFDEARARAIVAAVVGRAGEARDRKPSRESAPPLFDLTSLQREANRRFGWSARRTLGAAQRCYEAAQAPHLPAHRLALPAERTTARRWAV